MPHATRQTGTLERRLPIAMAILLTITIVVFGVFATSEVRRSSTTATTQRLRTVTAIVGQNLSRGAAARRTSASRLASESVVAAAARDPAANLAAVRSLLTRRRGPTDSTTLIAQLLIDRAGRQRVLVGPGASGDDSLSVNIAEAPETAEPSTLRALTLDSALATSRRLRQSTLSEFFSVDGELRYWVVAPIDTGDFSAGQFVEERRIRGTQTADQQLRDVTGQDFTFYLTDRTGRLWVGATGELEVAPFRIASVSDSFVVDGPNNDELFGRRVDIAQSPWKAVLVASSSSVYARSLVFLKRIVLVGVLLLAISGLVAWWISRQVTKPLHSLAEAAQAISGGDFTRREVVSRDDELGMLASSFNRMAQRVGDSHRQLETRIAESESLTAALEQRNVELQRAQMLATEAKISSDIARAEAQRANVAKSEFLAMMSHELRTPLSAIAGYAEILQLGIRGTLSEAARNDIARIQANQGHLLRIINDILDVAQVESGALVMSLRAVPLHAILAKVEAIVRPAIDEKGLQYIVTEHALMVHVRADPERLTQVLVNLIANAVRFTNSGGFVRVCASVADSRVLIRVTDSGVGIAAEHHEQVFQPFMQVDAGASRREQGTGLGLAISRRLIEAMGGQITLTSELGVGATFAIDLAQADAEVEADASTNARADTDAGSRDDMDAHSSAGQSFE